MILLGGLGHDRRGRADPSGLVPASNRLRELDVVDVTERCCEKLLQFGLSLTGQQGQRHVDDVRRLRLGEAEGDRAQAPDDLRAGVVRQDCFDYCIPLRPASELALKTFGPMRRHGGRRFVPLPPSCFGDGLLE